MTTIEITRVTTRFPQGGENQCVGCGLFFAGLTGFEFHVRHQHMSPTDDEVRYWVTDGARGPVWHFDKLGRRKNGTPPAYKPRSAVAGRPSRGETGVRVRTCRDGPSHGSWARYDGRAGTITARNDPAGEVEVTFDEGSPRTGWFGVAEYVILDVH